MNILITGANGFIGKNLVATLKNIRDKKDTSFAIDSEINIYECTRDTDKEKLEMYCEKADFVYHLAGVNRPKYESEFMQGNGDFTKQLVSILEEKNNCCPIVFSSSIQAEYDNAYGESKLYAEKVLEEYALKNKTIVYIYRLFNVFGKWCKPNYNSVVATFCYNIARGIPININDENAKIRLIYIDDVVKSFITLLSEIHIASTVTFEEVEPVYHVTVGEIARLLQGFFANRELCYLPETTKHSFSNCLYATYLSYLPEDKFGYMPKMNVDNRGSFTELFKTISNGQVSVNISKPGITKGEHWHHTKNEKFVVVSGTGLIQLRKLDEVEIIEYAVSGDKIEIIDIPPGYTHNIINQGKQDMVTIMWCNECFDAEKPDTYFLKVNEDDIV